MSEECFTTDFPTVIVLEHVEYNIEILPTLNFQTTSLLNFVTYSVPRLNL
jgi:hypothetical protein